jgi:hypothetical protein
VNLRAERAAENENLFRRINERVEELSAGNTRLALVCECADLTCVERLTVPTMEYEAVRGHPERFLVARGHEHRDVETVVDERPAYVVVAKFGTAGAVAAEGDPRSE